MNKKEVAELKKRFKKEDVSIDRISGCYVDAEKNKVYQFSQKFFTLPEEDMYKYMEIAKKALSGKVENNLLNLQFPTEEEKVGGRQHALMAILNTHMENEDFLNAFYDHVIEKYADNENYLILLFHDNYDVIGKGTDGMDNISEEVYEYILCVICPVSLSKASLGYTDNKIEAVKRDWLVGMPESGFLFPAFNDRSSDIHNVLFYTKNAKKPHDEVMSDILGCPAVSTAVVKQEMMHDIVSCYANPENEENTDDIVLAYNQELHDILEEHVYDGYDEDSLKMDKELVTRAAMEIGAEEGAAEAIAEDVMSSFNGDVPSVSSVISAKLLKQNESRIQILAMQEQIKDLMDENAKLKKMLEEK